MSEVKAESTTDSQEFETPDVENRRQTGPTRAVEAARLGLTGLALLAGIAIVATSADTLSVYNETHLPEDFLLPLWPSKFNIRPTIALVTCGTIILLVSAVSLAASKVPSIRSKTAVHRLISLFAPIICFIAGLIGTSFFYGVNASNTVSTLYSWSCQWSALDMSVDPHFNGLCKESKAALYLTVMIIPLEVLVLGAVAVDFVAGRAKKQPYVHERKGSPALS